MKHSLCGLRRGRYTHKWDDQYKTMQIDKYGSKIKKIAKSVKTVISTGVLTVNNIVMMENLYRNQESMHDTLVRVRSNATKIMITHLSVRHLLI